MPPQLTSYPRLLCVPFQIHTVHLHDDDRHSNERCLPTNRQRAIYATLATSVIQEIVPGLSDVEQLLLERPR